MTLHSLFIFSLMKSWICSWFSISTFKRKSFYNSKYVKSRNRERNKVLWNLIWSEESILFPDNNYKKVNIPQTKLIEEEKKRRKIYFINPAKIHFKHLATPIVFKDGCAASLQINLITLCCNQLRLSVLANCSVTRRRALRIFHFSFSDTFNRAHSNTIKVNIRFSI